MFLKRIVGWPYLDKSLAPIRSPLDVPPFLLSTPSCGTSMKMLIEYADYQRQYKYASYHEIANETSNPYLYLVSRGLESCTFMISAIMVLNSTQHLGIKIKR